MGFEFAKLCVQKGAKVTLIARDKSSLETARKELLNYAPNKDEKNVGIQSADVSKEKDIYFAIQEACKERGEVEWLICNAGSSRPDTLDNLKVADYKEQIELNYLGLVNTFKSVQKDFMTKRKGEKKRLVCVSSALGICAMGGYSAYCPTKWAVRGFCETLRNELSPFSVSIHVFYASTMDTPGYKEEQIKKPAMTKKMEEGNIFTAQQAASHLFEGIRKDNMGITSEWLVELLLMSANGISNNNNIALHILISPLIPIICYFVKSSWDSIVKQYQHRKNI